jgi:potassium voltage-gated channel Eag-related subfamily H protein 8
MLNPNRAPGMDLITAQMLKELLHEGLLNLLYIFNAVLRLNYCPTSLKRAQIMIPIPGKDPTDASSYRPISLLPIISKVLEKLLHKRTNKNKNQQDWIPHHQFRFRQVHSTVKQCHNRHHKQSSRRSSVLQSSLPRHQPGF